MKRLTSLLLTLLFVSGCMSDKEFWLRQQQMKNLASYPPNYEVITLEGAVTIEIKEGGKVAVRQPNQPMKELYIPDGISTQEQLVSHLIDIGAITVLGWKAIKNAKTTKTTVINNNNAVQP